MAGIVIALVWIACSIASIGFDFAYFQGKFPSLAERDRRDDMGGAILRSLAGPVSLLVVFCLSGFGQYGWRLWARKEPMSQAGRVKLNCLLAPGLSCLEGGILCAASFAAGRSDWAGVIFQVVLFVVAMFGVAIYRTRRP